MKFENFESQKKQESDDAIKNLLFTAAYETVPKSQDASNRSIASDLNKSLPTILLTDFDNEHRLRKLNNGGLESKLIGLAVDPTQLGVDANGETTVDSLVENLLGGVSGDAIGNGVGDKQALSPIDSRQKGVGLDSLDATLLPPDIFGSPDRPGANLSERLREHKGSNLQEKRGPDPRAANGSPGWNRPDQAPPPATPFGEGSLMNWLSEKAKETQDAGLVNNKVTAINDALPARAPTEDRGGAEQQSPAGVGGTLIPVSDIVEAVDKAITDETNTEETPEAPVQTDVPKSNSDVMLASADPDSETPYLDYSELQAEMGRIMERIRQSLTNTMTLGRNRDRSESLGRAKIMGRVSNPNPEAEGASDMTPGSWRGSLSGIGGGDPAFQSK